MPSAASNGRNRKTTPPRAAGPASKSRRATARSSGSSAAAARDGGLRFTIPSDPVEARDVQKRIMDDIARHGYDSHCSFAIKLALEEALVNAIKHGNKFDRTKKVHIEAKITPKQAEICIEDEGEGFKRVCVPDPTAEENLEKCSGRGILLIEAYMNKVQYSRGGRRLRMVKKNEQTPPADE